MNEDLFCGVGMVFYINSSWKHCVDQAFESVWYNLSIMKC